MEYVKIDLEQQIKWYTLFCMIKNCHPNADLGQVIEYVNNHIYEK